ncbi:MazG nucleotide pyrophosphohydrolase domain-containing protein [Vibrio gangliei]|uniref:MazG nucleotide pyrophosphohydrolase domain-containing protein n=1 Tax=Vibrio gangliei TaxID=2077090 RepID=UPI000D01DD50|nr:MazG nucleotide pyrophosphohydrolase domain-containing protein [Vibrio gangliei]
MKEFDVLLRVAERKAKFDQTNLWSNGSETYLAEMKKEIDEVSEEIPKNRQCYLEEELGDVLWDYLNVLTAIKKEQGICPKAVLTRAIKKYEERVSGIEVGESWASIKERQKIALAQEQNERTNK